MGENRIMTHRKHIHEREIEPVATVIREHLTKMVPYHDSKERLTSTEQSLFNVLYRFETNQVGKPSYPQPQTWGTITTYLGVMVPLHSLCDVEEELDTTVPNGCIPALANMEGI